MKSLIFFLILCLGSLSNAQSASRINAAALRALHPSNYDTSKKVHTLYSHAINHADVNYGFLACARVVAAVLSASGVIVPRLTNGVETRSLALAVYEVETKLSQLRWKKVYQEQALRPGDVIVWRGLENNRPGYFCAGNGSCHVGIVTTEGIFHNNYTYPKPNFDTSVLEGTFVFKIGYRPPHP